MPLIKKRYKTIELKVEEVPWTPGKNDSFSQKQVYIRVHYNETKLRQQLKRRGAVWHSGKKVWEVVLQTVLDLNIEDRIVELKK